jgi:predicted RNA-binding Zn-ribbon protein involved in translation (DUF1610 family)
VWFCVGAGLIGIFGIALIILATKYSSPICPNCGHRAGHKMISRRIPGSEHDFHSAEHFSIHAKFWSRYTCQNCGHKWSEEETRQIT